MVVLVLPILLEVGYWKAKIAIVNFRWKFAKHRKSEKYHVTEFPECLDNICQIKTKVAQKCRSCKETVLTWWRHEVIILKFHGKHTKTTVGSDFKVSKQFLVLQMLNNGDYIMRVPWIYWGLTKVCSARAADKYNGCLSSTNHQQHVVDFDNWNASILKWPIMCNKCAKQFRLRDCVLKTWYIFILATANIGFHISAEPVTQILKTLAGG